MTKPFLYFLLFLSGAAPLLHAQEYNYKQYTTEEGLAADITYNVIQDHNGFIWIGTGAGISRFDGKNFKKFTTADGLSSNEAFGCIEDSKDRLWIICFSKQVCYYKNGKIYNKENSVLLSKISFPQLVRNVTIDKDKNVIIWDYAFNIVIIDSNDRITRHNSASYKIDYIKLKKHSIVELELLRLPENIEQAFQQYFYRTWLKPEDIYAKVIADHLIVFTPKHHPSECIIWNTVSNKWVHLYDPSVRDYILLGKYPAFITDRSGATGIYNYLQQRNIGTFLPGEIVNCIFQDREENLWFTTKGNGVFKLGNRKIRSYKFNDQPSPVKFIIERDQGMLVGLENDHYWTLNTEYSQERAGEVHTMIGRKTLLTKESLIYGIRNRLIAMNNSMFLSDRNGNVKTLYASDSNALTATSSGVFIYKNLHGKGFSDDTLYTGRSTAAIKHQEHYYIGTLGGLLLLDEHQILSRLLPYHITYILADTAGFIWVATYDSGVFKIKNDKVIGHINKANNGISSNFCRNLTIDGTYLWIGTNTGLNKVKIDDLNASVEAVFSTGNGLSSNMINAVYIRDSIVYVGTSKGLNIVDQRIEIPPPLFNLLFTDILVSDTTVLPGQKILLPHRNNKILFHFNAISFSLESIIYQYRLAELGEEWQHASGPSLSFVSLPSGTYTLQVRALSPSGQMTRIIEREFEVKKALSEEWWFRSLIGGLLFLTAYLVVNYRIKYIRKQEAKKNSLKRKLMELEHTALRAQINPHFIFNCLNSVQNYILKQDTEGANLYLSQFAELIRKTLDNFPKLYISLHEEISYLRTYIELEQLQANYPFDYLISNTATDKYVLFPTMILQPFIENAIKHGLKNKEKGGRLYIKFSKPENNLLLCIIEDNGCGIEASCNSVISGKHKPKGMQLIKNRIEVLNAINSNSDPIRLEVEDLVNSGSHGTRVQIRIPIQ